MTGYVRLESLRLAHEAVELSSLSEAYHVYEAASYDAQAVGTLRSGQTVTVVDVDGEWASIRTQEVKGYIPVSYTHLDVYKRQRMISLHRSTASSSYPGRAQTMNPHIVRTSSIFRQCGKSSNVSAPIK